MRKLITFIVVLIAIIAVMDHVHVPPNKALADVKHSVTQKETSKPKTENIESASYAPPLYTIDGGCEQYRKLFGGYDWDSRVMLAVMEAETHCRSNAVGDNFPINGVLAPSCGLLQVRTIAAWRGTCDQLKDRAFNVDIAYRVWQGQGYKAWSLFNNGTYLQYLR